MSIEKKLHSVSWAALQIDKVTWFLLAGCALPFLFHLIPWGFSVPIGAVWLPLFYAPCIAALLYRPHVGILAGLIAPGLNFLLFGRPESSVLMPLTADLFIFTALTWAISRRLRFAAPLIAFLAARLITSMLWGGVPAPVLSPAWWAFWADRAVLCAPGILMLLILGIVCDRWKERT